VNALKRMQKLGHDPVVKVLETSPSSWACSSGSTSSLAKTDDALLVRPHDARLLYVLAHGAGAGMRHHFLAQAADVLCGARHRDLPVRVSVHADRKSRPDSPGVAEAAVRQALPQRRMPRPGCRSSPAESRSADE